MYWKYLGKVLVNKKDKLKPKQKAKKIVSQKIYKNKIKYRKSNKNSEIM